MVLLKANLMKAFDVDSLSYVDIDDPRPGYGQVVVKVVEAGVNPIDYFAVSGMGRVEPMPHIPGAEFAGVVEEVGPGVKDFRPGDRVVVYPRVFCGRCDMCMGGHEHLCRFGGIVGMITHGGFAEKAVVNEANLFRLPDNVPWDLAASLPVAALTPFHALLEAGVGPGDVVAIVGASGNTGQFALQLAKIMGARVLAVSTKKWPLELGADAVAPIEQSYDALVKMTGGKLADVVIDAIGTPTLPVSMKLLDRRGRLAIFGALRGETVTFSVPELYNREVRVIGTTGGTRAEMAKLIDMASRRLLKVKVWRKLPMSQAKDALRLLFSRERDGRIMLVGEE
ncbi:alcohol dehydrogenase catalytic domain-containing protein [Acidilobus sp.]|uniref:alcohol dehydrogenase catalytic domain-containing protein n=1 Tax=Acidilobus sp. TaxID=1872109 RepID=UPI003CFFC58A